MAKRKKKISHRFILLVIVILLLFFFKNSFLSLFNNSIKEPNDKIDSKYSEIVSTSEKDNDVVKEVFTEGMKIDDFKKILDQEDNYIKNTHEYKKIYYNFEEKLRYSEIEDYLKELNKSDIVKLEVIGKSVDNRNIYSVEIGKGEKTILIDSNIHAAETANTLIVLKYMITIVNSYEENNKEIVNLLNNSKIVILPSINPDGYEIYNYGIESLNNKNLWIYKNRNDVDYDNFKYNANGVDINRNMPTQNAGLYYEGKKLIDSVSLDKTTSNGTYHGGKSLGSEPETKALIYFMIKHYKNTKAYINLHSQGRILYQGKPNLSDEFNESCLTFGNFISDYTNYIVKDISSEEVGEGNDGSATDFMAELANGLKFSDKTGRLSTDSYLNNNYIFKYKYPVITMETLNRYTRDPKYYKEEYQYRNFYDLFTNLIKNYID